MEKTRLSVDMDTEEHQYLKKCCAKLGVSVKTFVVKAVVEAVEAQEDEWLFAQIEDEPGENFVFIERDGKINEI